MKQNMNDTPRKISRASVTYEWAVENATDIEHRDNNGRLTVRPRKLKVHAGGNFRKAGELDVCIEGRRVRQADGELSGHTAVLFTDDTRYSQAGIDEAPEWVRELVDCARDWEAMRRPS